MNFAIFLLDPILMTDYRLRSCKGTIITVLKDLTEDPVLTADLVKPSDTVLLIAPQDIQAPKGRLILPQVQVIRDLLDNGCMVLTVTTENLKNCT